MIMSLNVGRPQLVSDQMGQVINSGIRKKPVPSAYLYRGGFENDGIADRENHGGEERAVCFYPYEHYHGWNELIGRELQVPAFGENITIRDYAEDNVFVGDVFRIGDAVVQITQSRIPCAKVDIFNRVRGLFQQFVQTGKTGYFAKVLEEGKIEQGSTVSLEDRLEETISIAGLNRLFFYDRENVAEIERVIEIEPLAAYFRERLRKLL